jgi:hypothetical protein
VVAERMEAQGLVMPNVRSLSGLPQRSDGGLPQEYFGAVSIELRMGLRSTHRDENRFDPRAFRMELAWNGKGRNDPGAVEAVIEFGPGCVFEPIFVAPFIP